METIVSINYKYAQVIVDIPALELNMRTFSYLIPEELRGKISVGTPVSIPFGRQDPVFGYVVGFTDYVSENIKVKPIFEVLDDQPLFDLKYLEFIEWVSNKYLCSLVSAISTAIPSGLWSSIKRVVTPAENFNDETFDTLNITEHRVCNAIKAAKSGEISPTTISRKTKISRAKLFPILRKLRSKNIINVKNLYNTSKVKPKLVEYVRFLSENTPSKRHKQILEVLLQEPEKTSKASDFVKIAKTTRPTLKKLEQLGLIEFFRKEEFRNPLSRFDELPKDTNLPLLEDQQNCYDRIIKELKNSEDPGPLLLHGVTGSGKTEVYFQVMQKVIEQGKTVIFLVPEITLTSQISARMIARFGPQAVGIWHSALSAGERLDIWRRIHSGEIRIVLGARSAVFAPVQDLGLIVMDEEHESAYKQDTPSPRYHARDVAIERARRYSAKVLLGSATPDITTYYIAKNSDKILSLPERIEARPMPEVHLIDMKEEMERGNKSIFSRSLSYHIQETVDNGHQVILLINRRGFTTYVFCRSCGYVAQCKHCAIPLIYHYKSDQLRCHYCNFSRDNYKRCPECDSTHIKHYGTGTQKVEQELSRKFPDLRILRLDSDVTTKKNAHYEIIESFAQGQADVLIGTQMVAKGLDLHNVTLVGVLASDSSFTFPDYRAMERGFQLLTQVAGRAGRGEFSGNVIFQCYSPDIYAIACAQKQDYGCFYSLEIVERENYGYPPFSQLIRIVISSESYEETFTDSLTLANFLNENLGDLSEKLEILGPSDCLIPKIQNRFRMQVLIKNLMSIRGQEMVSALLRTYQTAHSRMIVDVDALNML